MVLAPRGHHIDSPKLRAISRRDSDSPLMQTLRKYISEINLFVPKIGYVDSEKLEDLIKDFKLRIGAQR